MRQKGKGNIKDFSIDYKKGDDIKMVSPIKKPGFIFPNVATSRNTKMQQVQDDPPEQNNFIYAIDKTNSNNIFFFGNYLRKMDEVKKKNV